MESEQHPIDQIFRDALYQREETPPAGTWESIRQSLDQREQKGTIVFWRSVAAGFLVVISLGTGYWLGIRQVKVIDQVSVVDKSLPVENSDLLNKKNTVADNPISSDEIKIQNNKKVPVPVIEKTLENSLVSASANESNVMNKPDRINDELPGIINPLAPCFIKGEQGPGKLQFASITPIVIPPEREIEIDLSESGNENIGNRWSIGGQASPLYSYRDLRDKKSTLFEHPVASVTQQIAPQNPTVTEHPVFSYSSGLNVNYKLSDRIQFESGLYYSTAGIGITASIPQLASLTDTKSTYNSISEENSLAGNSVSNSTGRIEGLNKMGPVNSLLSDKQSNSEFQQADILQHMGFIEFPLIMRVKILGSKLKVGMHGGIITDILTSNSVIYNTGNEQVDIGPTSDLRKINYSGSMGLGAYIPISQRWQLSMEPTFRYAISAIYSGPGYASHPYSFGVFTGISYSF